MTVKEIIARAEQIHCVRMSDDDKAAFLAYISQFGYAPNAKVPEERVNNLDSAYAGLAHLYAEWENRSNNN